METTEFPQKKTLATRTWLPLSAGPVDLKTPGNPADEDLGSAVSCEVCTSPHSGRSLSGPGAEP
jgi:hypothetical protein